jgi:RHS repeat-associated protein
MLISRTMHYDARGNLTNDGQRVFFYDAENQLTTVLASNAWKSEFAYDGFMRRRVRKEFGWSGSAWVQTNEIRYVYDGRLVVQERHYNAPQLSTLNPHLVTYTRGNDLSGTLQGAGGIGGLLARSEPSTLNPQLSTALYHADGNGNITALVTTNGTLAARYHYDPYGNILSMAGPLAEANLYRFSSKEWHVNSGMVYYLYRYYEPKLQRWVNRDPIEEWGGVNLFCFIENKVLSFYDPFGLIVSPEEVACAEQTVENARRAVGVSEGLIAEWNRQLKEASSRPGRVRGSLTDLKPAIDCFNLKWKLAEEKVRLMNARAALEAARQRLATSQRLAAAGGAAGGLGALGVLGGLSSGTVLSGSAGVAAAVAGWTGVGVAAAGGAAVGYAIGSVEVRGQSIHEWIGQGMYNLCPSCF